MNTHTRATTHGTSRTRARRAASLTVAGLLAGLALAPTSAFASHPTSEGGGTVSPSGDRWSYMYDVAQRKEAMAQQRVTNAIQATPHEGAAATASGNPWSYMYDVAQTQERVAHPRLPLAKARHDSVVQRKAHPALARIVVSLPRSGPATCYLPDTIDPGTRRLIAVQLCGKAHIVPALFVDRAAYFEESYSLGHL